MPRETQDFEDGFKSALIESGKSQKEAEEAYDDYMNTTVTKEMILGTVSDLVTDLLYYDRKEDEDLPRGAIEKAIETEVITLEEIIKHFSCELTQNL